MKHALSLAILVAASCGCVEAQAQTVWQLASGYSEEAFQTVNLKRFAAEVGVATRGKLKIEVHANNTLVRLADIPDKVASGDIAAGETIMSNLESRMPVAGADSVPFLVGSYADARRLWLYQRPTMDAKLAEKGMVELYAVAWPPQGLYSIRPIKVASDLKGMKMRTYNKATRRIAEQLGAQPVDVMMVELNQAMAAGRVEAMITSGATGIDSKAWEKLKYFYDIHAWYPKNIVLVNQAAFNALEPGTQETLRSVAANAEKRGWQMSETAAASSLTELTAHGMHLDPIDFQFRSELLRFGERFSVEWVHATGQDSSSILIPYYTAKAH
jgi:TRAP-type C4-dicarboxylate transport system substrate-binding protein